jgi:hypothetical protein
MGDMSDSAPPPTCMNTECACYRDQSGLTSALLQSDDPHVRIIAHLSSRQLAMVESINNMQLTERGLIQAINGLTTTVRNGFESIRISLDNLQLDHGIIEEVEEEVEKGLAAVVGTIPPRSK